MDDENGTFEAVLFPQIYRQYPLLEKAVYALTGKITEEFGVTSLEVHSVEKLVISFKEEKGEAIGIKFRSWQLFKKLSTFTILFYIASLK